MREKTIHGIRFVYDENEPMVEMYAIGYLSKLERDEIDTLTTASRISSKHEAYFRDKNDYKFEISYDGGKYRVRKKN